MKPQVCSKNLSLFYHIFNAFFMIESEWNKKIIIRSKNASNFESMIVCPCNKIQLVFIIIYILSIWSMILERNSIKWAGENRAVALMCHWCATYVPLMCHLCATYVPLMCHSDIDGTLSNDRCLKNVLENYIINRCLFQTFTYLNTYNCIICDERMVH